MSSILNSEPCPSFLSPNPMAMFIYTEVLALPTSPKSHQLFQPTAILTYQATLSSISFMYLLDSSIFSKI